MKTFIATHNPLPAIVPFAVLFVFAVALPLYGDQFGDFTYADHETYIEITEYPTIATGLVVIPATIVGKPVTRIGSLAFYGCSGLTGITIPSSVSEIGAGAFHGCSGLTSIAIPSNLAVIDNDVFRDCSGLTSVSIPSGVTGIYNGAFHGCSGLTDVAIPSRVSVIDTSAFQGCSGLTSIAIPSFVSSIGPYAFQGCSGLTSAIFLDDAAPHTSFAPGLGTNAFGDTAPGFTVHYPSDSYGFTSPTWNGYPSVEVDQAVHPAATWLLSHGLPYDTDLNQDLNNDGVYLLMAYALNLDPDNALAEMPVPILGSGTLSLTFYGAAQGVTYGAETSTALQNWGSAGVTLSAPDPDGMRTATIDTTAPRRFMRLGVIPSNLLFAGGP